MSCFINYGNGLIYEKTENCGILVYHYNHLGSTVAITDGEGKLLLSYDYGTYGALNNTTEYATGEAVGALTIRFLYNGQLGVMSDDNGLYHMRARYYNPDIKRFINQDVLIGNIGNNASLNRYSYVEGNPISYTDPFGLSPWMQAIHAGLDLLGAIPGFEIFDAINAAIYFLEGNWVEGLKSLVYMVPGMDLMTKATKYAVEGGKYARQALLAAEYATIAGRTMAALFASGDFGKTVASMIDRYLVNGEELSWYTAVEFLQLVATGAQTINYTGAALMLPSDLAKYDFDAILDQNIRARYETTPVNSYMSGEEINYSSLSGTGEYGKVRGHHIHAKAAFRDDVNYDPNKGFSISQDFMNRNGLDHQKMTIKQRQLFKELFESGRPNTLAEHTRIAREALKAGGASDDLIDYLINESLLNLAKQGVTQPTGIPWYQKKK